MSKDKEPKTVAQFTQKFLIEEVLKNDLRRDETKIYIERHRNDPYMYNHGHINQVPLYLLDEAIKVYEKNLGRKKRGSHNQND